MKKLLNLALVGTMVLAALACQRENPGLNGAEDNGVREVTTQFVLNVTAAPQTKMLPSVVQQNNNFRGIEQGVLYTYKTGITGDVPYVLNPNTAADKTFEFPFFFAADALDNNGNNNQTGDDPTASKRVLQLSIPIGTDAVLFYGKAIKASGSKDSDFGDSGPRTVISETPNNTVISAQMILDEDTRTQYDRTGDLMIYLINDVLGTSVIKLDTPGEIGNYHYTSLPAISWAQVGHQYEIDHYTGTTSRYAEVDPEDPSYPSVGVGHPVTGLEEVLGKCYYLFTFLTPANLPDGITYGSEEWKEWVATNYHSRSREEYRAGSSTAVKSMIIDMYKVIKAAADDSEATDDNEANAKRLAEQILSNALKYFDGETGEFKGISTLKSANIVTAEYWAANFEGAKDLNKYPFEDFGIPEGAAQIGFHYLGQPTGVGTDTYQRDEFYYKLPNQPLVNPTMTEFEPKKYLYPAELWYYVNSPIRTSTDGNITAASYPDGVNKWNDETNYWTGWDSPGVVTSATRAVAVTHSINYGVALLKSVVSYSTSNLLDNRVAMTEETTPNSIPVSSANLQLRGILVGGQNPRMNWQFVRKYEAKGDYEDVENNDLSLFDGVIYDHSHAKDGNNKDIPVLIPSGTNASATFYTLVYDNYNSTEAVNNQNDVYVALEFVNGGSAFWGRDNMIPSGGVFYLVGKLPKPTAAQISTGLDWPKDHQIPPVDSKGVSLEVLRVFIQDFMTTANFKIGSESLQHAYYSIPDLRASQMSLGLSVDLKWETGLSFNVEL